MPRPVVTGPPLRWTDKDLASLLDDRFRRHAERPGFLVREGEAFVAWTWGDIGLRAREIAGALLAHGVRAGDRVAILADTRPEWALADYAILLAGAVTVTIYPTLTQAQVEQLLVDSGATLVFVDGDAQREKVGKRVETLDLRALDAVRERGRAHLAADPRALDARREGLRPSDPSTIIYTSGTTGVPKGAVLTHENWVATTRMMAEVFELEKYGEPRTTIAFLPMAHVLSRLLTLTFTDLGGTIAWSSPRTLAKDLLLVRPRTIVCVPRIWERMHEQIHKTVRDMPPHRRAVFARAEAFAKRYGAAMSDGGQPPLAMRVQWKVFDALVYRKLRARLGFDQLEGALSTAAAIRPDLLHFYQGIGVRVYELWGLTELTGPGTTTTPDRFKPGSVGWACPGVEVMLDEDHEICVSGPNVFAGYHAKPEENAAAFFEREGKRWFRTGDVGTLDEDGALRIVDRKKEIEVLDTGKKIAPIAVEERLKTVSPFVGECCMVATGRKYAAMLIQPNYDRLLAWARERGVPFDETRLVVRPDPTGAPMTYEVGRDLLDDPRVRQLFQDAVDACNARSADFESIRAFHLVPHVFTVDRDELTPTLKKKRRVIHAHYRDGIEALFRHEAR
ncbi:MAG TPA: long-chain fatty acid--CoA ligase [Candidatus Thermoplasmatota archaeon]|nr:long-chain fatty acid--CoA ligase [Candidatus Thermoplasmatota archaeon]